MKKSESKPSPAVARKASDPSAKTSTSTKTVTIQSPTDESKKEGTQATGTTFSAPQTPKTSSWRKREQVERQRQPEIYGYTPFNGPPFSTYDPRAHGVAAFSIPRPESAQAPILFDGPPSRPGTDMGLYRPAYYGPQFAPHPDHLDVESIYGGTQRGGPPSQLGDFYGPAMDRPPSRLSRCGYGGGVVDAKFRPGSAMSGQVSERGFAISTVNMPPAYQMTDGRIGKEVVNWTGLNLCSYMQIICGVSIFAIGVARMFTHADYAKGQELFYGISAVTAGLLGNLAARNCNYSLAVAAYVHSLVNALLAFIPFVSAILPVIPLLGIRGGGAFLQLNESVEPLEANFVLAVFSIIQFAVALFIAVYGCRTAGAAIGHLEQLRFQSNSGIEMSNEKAGF